MGRARSFLIAAGTVAATSATIISPAGVSSTFATNHPADTQCVEATGALPGADLVCTVVDTITTVITLPPTDPTSPPTIPTIPTATTLPAGDTGSLPTLPAGDTGSLPTLPAGDTGSLPTLPAGGLPVGAVPSLADVNVSPQICGIGAGVVMGSGTGDCPDSGSSSGTGGGVIGATVAPQVCGIGVGVVTGGGTGTCPTRPSSGSGGGLITIDVTPQVCGIGAGVVLGSGVGTCPTEATNDSVPTNNSVPGGGTPTNNSVPGGTPTNNSVVADTPSNNSVPTNSSVVANLSEAPRTPSATGRSGGGSLPITGISITAIALLGGALLHWGLIAKLLANRKVRRTPA